MQCERLSTCPFFNDRMAASPATADLFKQNYCKGDFAQCARYMVSSTGGTPPADLYPNDIERAQNMLREARTP